MRSPIWLKKKLSYSHWNESKKLVKYSDPYQKKKTIKGKKVNNSNYTNTITKIQTIIYDSSV